MRLLVKRGSSLVNDLRFEDGPIYIGRLPSCKVFLPDRNVSRRHALLYTNDQGLWMVQDLESANQTLVNNRPVSRSLLHEGDTISIADFSIEVHFVPKRKAKEKPQEVDLGDTLFRSPEIKIPSIFHASAAGSPNQFLQLPLPHLKNFYELSIALFTRTDQEELLKELTAILLKQFQAYHVWAGLREDTSGLLSCHGGIDRSGAQINLDSLFGRKIIQQAIQQESYYLLPNLSELSNPGDTHAESLQYLRSAMIAPITAPAGAYGVIYLDNGIDQPSYTRRDLDYLTLVSTLVASLIEHIG